MPPPPYPTQSLIAKRLGVSQGLVSRALAGRAELIGASPLTIKKIRRIASDWDYQPSVAALTLRGVPTRTMGVMVKNFDDPYFGQLIGALQFLARDSGHSLLLTGGTREDFTSLQKHRVDGVILAGSDFPTSDLSSFIQEGRPVVHIGTGPLFF
ncbi:MAG: hypothetical protein NTZ01_01800, partial [Verrucomicrobia bacterium]|nr:hypothetical protein [Verrucomicrobiota bacterium]